MFHLIRFQHAILKHVWPYASLMCLLLTAPMFSGCEKMRNIVASTQGTTSDACTGGTRVLNVGFYAYFEPVSYSADPDPNADGFNTHQGYEADLLTALEMMEGVGLSFSRAAIPEWPGIWLKSAEPAYDMIGGGITILDSRTKDAAGTPRVVFTSGHVKFRQSTPLNTLRATHERLAYRFYSCTMSRKSHALNSPAVLSQFWTQNILLKLRVTIFVCQFGVLNGGDK